MPADPPSATPSMTAADLEAVHKHYTCPWVQDLGIEIDGLLPDGVRIRMKFDDRAAHTHGRVSGQALLGLADTSMFLAIVYLRDGALPAGTANLSFNFMRPALRTDVIAHARILKMGRNLVFGDVMLYADGNDDPLGQASLTYGLLAKRG